MFDNSILFPPWCSSTGGVIFSSVCTCSCITRIARITCLDRLILTSKILKIDLLSVLLIFLLLRFPYVFGEYSILFGRSVFTNDPESFGKECSPMSNKTISGIPCRLKSLGREFITSLVSDLLHFFTDGHSVNLSAAMSICTSPCNYLLCSFPVNSIFVLFFR